MSGIIGGAGSKSGVIGETTLPNIWVVVAANNEQNWNSANTKLPIDTIQDGSNMGKAAYDTSAYQFVAPLDGVYFTIFSGIMADNHETNKYMQLRRSGTVMTNLYSSNAASTHMNVAKHYSVAMTAGQNLDWYNKTMNLYLGVHYCNWSIHYLGRNFG